MLLQGLAGLRWLWPYAKNVASNVPLEGKTWCKCLATTSFFLPRGSPKSNLRDVLPLMLEGALPPKPPVAAHVLSSGFGAAKSR